MMSKSLFLLGEVGGNDYNHLIVRGKSLDELHELVPNVIGAIGSAITELINLGAKKFVVPGNFPIGCVPLYLAIFPSEKEGYYNKETECIEWLNEFTELHNQLLQEELEKIRNLHPDVSIVYADYYGATMNIFRAPLQFGFTVPRNSCCGSDAPHNCSLSVMCGNPGSSVCPDPSKYISWDGLHFTEATYKIIIQGVLGSYAVPPLSETCRGGEYKISQLHLCTDNNPTNTVTYDAMSSFI
jgi:phospholipase/lecithinase/hemolysin